MKTKYQAMKKAGGVLREAFSLIFYYLVPGADLEKIDLEVGRFLSSKKAISGLRLVGFPYNMCASIDYEVIQGYPNRVLQDNQIVSVDMSILCCGVFVDKARTIALPSADILKHQLADTVNSVVPITATGLRAGVSLNNVGKRIKDILESDRRFRACNYFHGHGIGNFMHEEPMVPNYDNGSEETLHDGQFITIEPVVYGYPLRRLFFDHRWTITSDELSAHAEDTVYIRKDGAEVLT